jgi:hypothetical protein
MRAEFHACPESGVPPGRGRSSYAIPGNKLPGYYREVPSGHGVLSRRDSMKVARYEVPGQLRSAWNRQKNRAPVPAGRSKSGCAVNYACRISRLPRIKRPSGTRCFVPEGLNESSQVRSAWNGTKCLEWAKNRVPAPAGRLKSGCTVNYACRISHLPRIRRPSGTRPFFVCYPGNKLPGYYREVPPGQEA